MISPLMRSNRGSLLLLSVGATLFFAVLGGGLKLFSNQRLAQQTAKLDRMEGFYNNEVFAWHSYARNKVGLAPAGTPDAVGYYSTSIAYLYDQNLPPSLSETIPSNFSNGTPFNVKQTAQADAARTFMPRYHPTSENLRYRLPAAVGARSFCGRSLFAKSQVRLCLADKAVPFTCPGCVPALITCIGPATSGPPTPISSAAELLAMSDNGYYELTNDITLVGLHTPIPARTNLVLDGKNHRIINLVIDNIPQDEVGLISKLSCSLIRNLTFQASDVSSVASGNALAGIVNSGTGTLAGIADRNTRLEKVILNGGFVMSNHISGGLVGFLDSSEIDTSENNGAQVTGGNVNAGSAGGLVGLTSSNPVFGRTYIRSSHSSGVIRNAACTGGLVGTHYYSGIENSHSAGSVTTPNYVGGGLVGCMLASIQPFGIKDSYSHATVTAGSAGGLIGNGSGQIANEIVGAYATGLITGSIVAGGIAGRLDSFGVSQSYATGNVSVSTTNPAAWLRAGGLVGEFSGNISRSYARGNVTSNGGQREWAGGLVGFGGGIASQITDSYARGNVTANFYVGGLVASASNTTFDRTYSKGSVVLTGTDPSAVKGGLIAECTGCTVSRSYWDITSSLEATSPGGGTGLNTALMQTQASYVGWDFTTIWTISPGQYPSLQ